MSDPWVDAGFEGGFEQAWGQKLSKVVFCENGRPDCQCCARIAELEAENGQLYASLATAYSGDDYDRLLRERDEARRIAEALLYQTPMEGDLLKAVESWREEQSDE
jgi:hypothetical protein